jgi:hypothetical protein
MNTRNNQILEKINVLTKDIILLNSYSKDNINNNYDNEIIQSNPTFDFNRQDSLMSNPKFKEKFSSIFSEISNRSLTKNSSNKINLSQNENLTQNDNNILFNNEKRDILNKKKEDIMNLLNPYDSNINKTKNKNKLKKTSININKHFIHNDEVKFSDRVRKELNKVLYKDFPQNNYQFNEERDSVNLKNKNNTLNHTRMNTSSSFRGNNNINKKKDNNSIVETIQKLKIQYGI